MDSKIAGTRQSINILFFCGQGNSIKYIYIRQKSVLEYMSSTCLKYAQGYSENLIVSVDVS